MRGAREANVLYMCSYVRRLSNCRIGRELGRRPWILNSRCSGLATIFAMFKLGDIPLFSILSCSIVNAVMKADT